MIIPGVVAASVMKSITFSVAGGTDINLYNEAVAAGLSGQKTVNCHITAECFASATSTPAVEVGGWPAGTRLIVYIEAPISGRGGAGGPRIYGGNNAGFAGGPAIRAASAITGGSITLDLQAGGIVRGGGGGGGGGGGTTVQPAGQGAGSQHLAGGKGGDGQGPAAATAGSAGSSNSAGYSEGNGGRGGDGGAYGAAGARGADGSSYSGGAGGSAGSAIVGAANCTLVNWISGTNYMGPMA